MPGPNGFSGDRTLRGVESSRTDKASNKSTQSERGIGPDAASRAATRPGQGITSPRTDKASNNPTQSERGIGPDAASRAATRPGQGYEKIPPVSSTGAGGGGSHHPDGKREAVKGDQSSTERYIRIDGIGTKSNAQTPIYVSRIQSSDSSKSGQEQTKRPQNKPPIEAVPTNWRSQPSEQERGRKGGKNAPGGTDDHNPVKSNQVTEKKHLSD